MVKKLISMTLVLTLVSLFAITSAEAESKTRHGWPGAGIALGAILLGGLVAHQIATHVPPPPVVYSPPPEPRWYPPEPEYVPGHWEFTREWVPGTWERVWMPGYHDRWGNWVPGHYENRQTPRYYVDRRVWVEGQYRQN